MKLPVIAVAAFTVAAFVGGTAVAQMAPAATMQPIPNPPGSAMSHGTMHHHMRHHMRHHMMHHHMHHHMVHHMMKKSAKMSSGMNDSSAPMNGAPPADNMAPPPPPSPQ